MIAAEAEALYVKLFPQDDGEAIARLIEENQDKEARIIEEWRAVCASSFGDHELSERVFHQIYVPSLRYAYLCLWRRDVPALVSFARSLGDQLARARVPFAAFVAYLHFLRRSYTAVFADQPEKLTAILTHMEAVHAYLVGICADTYYEWGRAEEEATRDRETTGGTDAIPTFHGMVARSAGMQRVFDKIKRVAVSGSPVLILGETGTGKELVARAIHECGLRREGPFIAVNCAALPRELIESELFGYRRGAFSGAVTECVGLFRAAVGGTLLLDEITEMVPELQAKLLRVLQDKVVRPVGSVTETPVDVRVIASSNRDPEEALAAGALRADLYYRLSTSTIVLPPLRARREDIPMLVVHQLRRLREQQGPTAPPRRVGREAMALLVAQPWAGNVRELFNVVEDTYAMSTSEDIRLDDLQRAARMPVASITVGDPTPGTFQAAERDLLEEALRSTGGNKVQAARQLGISRTQLYAKMAKFGLVATAAVPKDRSGR